MINYLNLALLLPWILALVFSVFGKITEKKFFYKLSAIMIVVGMVTISIGITRTIIYYNF